MRGRDGRTMGGHRFVYDDSILVSANVVVHARATRNVGKSNGCSVCRDWKAELCKCAARCLLPTFLIFLRFNCHVHSLLMSYYILPAFLCSSCSSSTYALHILIRSSDWFAPLETVHRSLHQLERTYQYHE